MADPKAPEQKTLEMRVAELEEKLSKIHVTDEEMKAYHKVSSLLGGHPAAAETAAPAAATPQYSPQVCTVSRGVSRSISPRGITPINRGIISECYECTCGPCGTAGGGFTGGFGGLGQ